MTAQDRLFKLADTLEPSRREFQEKIGKSCAYIANIKNPSRRALKLIKEAYPQVNIDWIITGQGEMFVEGTTFNVNTTFRKAKNSNEGTAQHVGDNVDTNAIELVKSQNELMSKILEQSAKKDEQIDRLLALLEKNMKDGSN